MDGGSGPGRRPGNEDTRETILEAARAVFATRGYAGATIRAVAAEARVDPALVMHYFGSKGNLFASAMRFPFDPAAVLPGLLAGSHDGLGGRLANFVLDTLEQSGARERVVAMVRAAVSEEAAAEMLRRYLAEQVLGPVARHVSGDDAALRVAMAGSQIVGFVFARYVVGVGPLVGASRAELVQLLAPTLERYLVGPVITSGQMEGGPE